MLFSECTIQVIHDPSTGKPIHQVVKLAKDPETGHIVHMITDLPDVADTNSTYQAVTHKDPVTGKVTKDIVQITIDPESGETIEFPVDVPLGIFNLSFSVTFFFPCVVSHLFLPLCMSYRYTVCASQPV